MSVSGYPIRCFEEFNDSSMAGKKSLLQSMALKMKDMIIRNCSAFLTREMISEIRDIDDVPTKVIHLTRWKKFFEAKCNHDACRHLLFRTELVDPYVCNCEPPEEKEIISHIQRFKTNKIPEEDGLRAELFKCYPLSFISCLQQIYSLVWKEEIIPDEWSKSNSVPIPR